MMRYLLCIVLVLCSLLLVPACAVPIEGEGDVTAYNSLKLRSPETLNDVVERPLYAGWAVPVGTVSVWTENGNLMVACTTTGGWTLKGVRLDVECIETGFIPGMARGSPSKKSEAGYGRGWQENTGNSGYPVQENRNGNSIVGHFEYKASYSDGGRTTTGPIEVGPVTRAAVYVSAHATVARGGDTVPLPPPGVVTYLPVQYNKGGASDVSSLFTATITGGGLDGVYPAWCIDYDTAIRSGTEYTANFYPAYGRGVPPPPRDYEESDLSWEEILHCISYLINHKDGSYTFPSDDPFFPGETVSWSDPENWKELQGVMWWVGKPSLMPENMVGTSSGGQIRWDNRIAYAILSSAGAKGCTSFKPERGDIAIEVVDPYSPGAPETPRQLMVIELPDPCGPYKEKCAWGVGCGLFPGKTGQHICRIR
ncbi:hypothetical protein [Methanofollis ethanolicus]|uniref:hypothetical protein n=1 Tax=Methanofollis ethanolicus TaxID=488124 RepID=UPI00128F5A21|nr:hypothetical protein [Methanofollis ethanolicus]